MELLKSSVAMQEQMLGGKGFLVIGYLLEKVMWLFSFGFHFLTYNLDWLKLKFEIFVLLATPNGIDLWLSHAPSTHSVNSQHSVTVGDISQEAIDDFRRQKDYIYIILKSPKGP